MEVHVGELSKKIRRLFKLHASLSLDEDKKRIRCSLTGHEMPCKEEAVLSYIKGKKFQKARSRDSSNYDKYKPHLIPSTKKYHENQLFCMLTLRHINKTPEHVERHVNGARYKRALVRWQECERKGIKFVAKQRKRGQKEEESKETAVTDSAGEEADPEKEFDTASDKEEEDLGENDSFDDLYPAEDFKEEAEGGDSEYDFDADDLNDSKDSGPTTSGKASETKRRKGEKKSHKRCKKKQRTG